MSEHNEPSIGVGVLGFGTVGAGVVDGLLHRTKLIQNRTGLTLTLRGVADLELERDRGVAVDRSRMTTDAAALIDDPSVNVVVELIGGTGAARDLILRALEQGKPVVTANKALLAKCGSELFEAARKHKTGLFFEASVGGGIPIIRAVREGLVSNRFQCIYGILNGTCNYILTRMETEDAPFDEVLSEAQREGYAEADAALDIDGHDTAHKACILTALAHGRPVPLESVPVQGIRGLSSLDIAYAKELGYRIKLLAVIRQVEKKQVETLVRPALVPEEHILASVDGVFNAIVVSGDTSGDTVYIGRGAGRNPTASAVLGDIADAASRCLTRGPWATAWLHSGEPAPPRKHVSRVPERHYLRLTLKDQPGILARVARVLGEHNISIASVIQKESSQDAPVPVVVITHPASGQDLDVALRNIDALDCVGAPTVHFNIEDFETDRA